MTDYELTKGVALVLIGPQGSGKTTLANEIAQPYGRVRSISGFGLYDAAAKDALRDSPDVLIVDEVTDSIDIDIVKALVANDTVAIGCAGNGVVYKSTPTYIICTGSPAVLHIARDDRRFRVVDVGAQARGREEIEAENAELRDMLVAAYRELQRHGAKSVPLGYADVSITGNPTADARPRCRCTAASRQMLTDVGLCPDCGQAPVMDDEGPFSSCRCGTQEDYGTRPLQAMQLGLRRTTESVHQGASPFDWRCRCVAGPQEYVEVTLPKYPGPAGITLDVEHYIRSLSWSEEITEHEKALVAGNIRTFYHWLLDRSNNHG